MTLRRIVFVCRQSIALQTFLGALAIRPFGSKQSFWLGSRCSSLIYCYFPGLQNPSFGSKALLCNVLASFGIYRRAACGEGSSLHIGTATASIIAGIPDVVRFSPNRFEFLRPLSDQTTF